MIQINNQEYNNYSTNIDWESFSVSSYNQKRTGLAPFITFNIDNKIFIGLELTFSDEMIKDCQKDTKLDITKYLSDICYEDEKGWISLGTGKYTLYITRLNDNNFKLNFVVEDGEIKIAINNTIELLT